jgi:hypothetical protein
MPYPEPASEIMRPGGGGHSLAGRRSYVLSDDTGVLPIRTDAITVANIVVVRMVRLLDGTFRVGTSVK